MALFIGIDLGTSGCRAIAIDEQHNIQGNAIISLPEPVRSGHRVEQEPGLWWDAVCTCLTELTTHINTDDVKTIAVDGTSATLLLADKRGEPLCPALMYNDARAVEQANIISDIAPDNTAAQGPTSALAKLLCLFKEGLHKEGLSKEGLYGEESSDMKILNTVSYATHQADWISAKLCGRYGISDINNALKLGFDAENNQWPDWLYSLLDDHNIPRDILPNVVKPGTAIGTITQEFAKKFNLPVTTRIVAGTTDSTASFIATGANSIGDAVTSLGSTLVLKVISDKPVFAPEYGVYSQPLIVENEKRWLVGGASNTGGAVLKQYFTTEQLNAMTPRLDPETSTGLEYYPLPATGERFPINDANMEARLEPRPKDDVIFFQGMLEGIARIEAKGYHLLSELGTPYPVTVRTTGGGSGNQAWTAIRKRMLSEQLSEQKETQIKLIDATQTDAAYGSALLAKKSWYGPNQTTHQAIQNK